jgi:hypothetical protein
MRKAILTLVSLVALGAPALAQESTDAAGGSTTTTESTNTSTTSTVPATQKTTTTTTRKAAPVAAQKTTTVRHTSRSGISVRPVSVNRNTVVTPTGASTTTTVSH